MPRLLHTAASFVFVTVAYWAYAATVVPLIEPAGRRAGRDRGGGPVPHELAAPESKYAALFAGLFPPDHWTRSSPPKTFEEGRGQGMFVFRDYHTHDDGRIEIEPCVLIYFPTPWSRSAGPPPRDAIVLESPEGAVVQLDEPIR